MKTAEEILNKLEELLKLDKELLEQAPSDSKPLMEQLIKIDEAIINWIKA